MNLRTVDLTKLNSITKYPSIPTYHPMGERGRLGEVPLEFTGRVYGSEKVDGTNARVVLIPGGSEYLIGSREELLHARGDVIHNPSMGIVDALRPIAETLVEAVGPLTAVRTLYFEVFGGNVGGNARQYTGDKRFSFRLFDVADVVDYEDRLASPPEAIALWREGGGQGFAAVDRLRALAGELGLDTVPSVVELNSDELPRTLTDARDFLARVLPASRCTLDERAGGRAEGLVIRSLDRRQIAKLRFEDYERTLRKSR